MTARLSRLYDIYLGVWALGAGLAGLGHLVTNEEQAAISQWAHSPGWQREIGIFNIALAMVLVYALREGDDSAKRALSRVGIVLSLLLAANHAEAMVDATGATRLHWTALGLNALNGTTATFLLLADRRSRRSRSLQARVQPV